MMNKMYYKDVFPFTTVLTLTNHHGVHLVHYITLN